MDTRIYICAHKDFTMPDDEEGLYIPLQVGAALNEPLFDERDNAGENISAKNPYYSELTGLYWIWKNVRCDVVGICHYRRYFVENEDYLRKTAIEGYISGGYDVIAPAPVYTSEGSVWVHYEKRHNIKDLNILREVISEKYPEYIPAFDDSLKHNFISSYNMIIAGKETFDAYCAWLFDILFEVEQRTDISGYDSYQQRIYGFLSERLFRVWLLMQPLRIKEIESRALDPVEAQNAVKAVEIKRKVTDLYLEKLITIYKKDRSFNIIPEPTQPRDFAGKIPVWICWWQGMDEAPEIVKVCIESIRRNMPKGAEVTLITLENVGEYVTFPDWVVGRFNAGKITMTTLSDLLRAELLYYYGGLWIDATYYITRPFPEDVLKTGEFATIRLSQLKWKADVTKRRWSGNFMYCAEQGMFLPQFIMNAFAYFWIENEEIPDYYFIDYIIDCAVRNFSDVRELIEGNAFAQGDVFRLAECLDKIYDNDRRKILENDTFIYKLNRKMQVLKKTIYSETTYFGHLLGG